MLLILFPCTWNYFAKEKKERERVIQVANGNLKKIIIKIMLKYESEGNLKKGNERFSKSCS